AEDRPAVRRPRPHDRHARGAQDQGTDGRTPRDLQPGHRAHQPDQVPGAPVIGSVSGRATRAQDGDNPVDILFGARWTTRANGDRPPARPATDSPSPTVIPSPPVALTCGDTGSPQNARALRTTNRFFLSCQTFGAQWWEPPRRVVSQQAAS